MVSRMIFGRILLILLAIDRFWSSAPHLESQSPVFLKSALHINIANLALAGDDGLVPQSSSGRVHSLDSNYTTDVLRYGVWSLDTVQMNITIQYNTDVMIRSVLQSLGRQTDRRLDVQYSTVQYSAV